MRKGSVVALMVVLLALHWTPAARAQPGCGRVALFTLPGVTWEEVRRVRPPSLLDAARDGAIGSMSVRTVSARLSYAAGYATLGAGGRIEGPETVTGTPIESPGEAESGFLSPVSVGALAGMRETAESVGFASVPGALGSALGGRAVAIGNGDYGADAPSPTGYARWSLLVAMDEAGLVSSAATGPAFLIDDAAAPFGVRTDQDAIARAAEEALETSCDSAVVIDHGDLTRADRLAGLSAGERLVERAAALRAADELLERVRDMLRPEDLLLIVTPTSPRYERATHLGVAIAVGGAFPAGSNLQSASTRRAGTVTLPDVAPTVLAHLGIERPSVMSGRAFVSVRHPGAEPIASAVALDRETVFMDGIKQGIYVGFVVVQVLVYLIAIALFALHRRGGQTDRRRLIEEGARTVALGVVAFPVATYLMGVTDGHRLGTGLFLGVLIALDVALVAIATIGLSAPLDRLLALTALTVFVLIGDLIFGAPLQLNTAFGYSPVVAGRFAGAGNTAFSILGAAALVTGALVVHRWGVDKRTLAIVGGLFVLVVIVDGAPQFGSDVGGVIALVPSFGITWLLFAGRRPELKVVLASVAVVVGVLGVFLALDFSRPPGERTHFARFVEDVRARGSDAVLETIGRKIRASLATFRGSIWAFFIPPALAVMAWLLTRPRDQWRLLARLYPRLREGLLGGLLLAVIGFAVNDSGISIPAVILSFLVPMALIVHLLLKDRLAA
ncbi:MAG: hypothetical protein ACRDKB_09585 [Actinomycetota bacterium]